MVSWSNHERNCRQLFAFRAYFEIGLSQGREEFVAHHVIVVGKTRPVGRIAPTQADHRLTNSGGGQGFVDFLAPLAWPDAGHVAKDLLSPEGNAELVIQPPAGPTGVIPTIADEDSSPTIHRLRHLTSPDQRSRPYGCFKQIL